MTHAVLLGAGNVASHLYRAFANSPQLRFIQVYNRNLSHIDFTKPDTPHTDNLSELLEADLYLVCVSDTAISELSAQLPFSNRLVVHCSGGLAMDLLPDKNRKGVFYPLQTFVKTQTADFSRIPICIEADNPDDEKSLFQLAESISHNVQLINSTQRTALHLAAVYVNNFTNYLFQIGEDILKEQQMDFNLLQALIENTIENLKTSHSPKDIQTGPARRGDITTIEKHLLQLKKQNQKDIYITITNSILQQYGRKKL